MKSTRGKLLVVDDDQTLCWSLFDYLTPLGLEVFIAHKGSDALDICSKGQMDVVLLDQKLPDGRGSDFCKPILRHNDGTKIIFITAYPSFDNALEAIKAGACDYLSKPFELEELRLVIDRAVRTIDLERVEQIEGYRQSKESEQTVLIGNSDAFAEIVRMIALSAASDAAVLITGETGTGKNVVAKSIHYASFPRRKSFISLNCSAMPENLVEAELFGHEKGAYTGAAAAKRGVFEMAEGGTIFLDEIGDMPIHLQSKLLSVLDDKTVKRLGGESSKPVDVRIIAATNVDLRKAIAKKKFREDLYYRLSVIRMHIPPLMERKHDIPDLCRYLIKNLGGGLHLTMPESELTALMEYGWPGNVRELKNVMERAIILRKGNVIRPSKLLLDPQNPCEDHGLDRAETQTTAASLPGSELTTLREVERTYISHALGKLQGNYSRTARTLGISLSTLKRKLKDFGLI